MKRHLADIIKELKVIGAKKAPFPKNFKPMLATKDTKPFDGKDWLFEIKWDGYRIIAEKHPEPHLFSRERQNYTTTYSTITKTLSDLPYSLLLDGEVIMLGEDGKPSFDDLQKVKSLGPERLMYCCFDILWFEGYSLLDVPLSERKKILGLVIPDNLGNVFIYPATVEKGKDLYQDMIKKDMEGIVAKRVNSTYSPGKRVTTWLKIPTKKRQEFVIGGWTESESGRPFRSLLFGYYENDKLICYGHSGGGYKDKDLREIKDKLSKIEIKKKPFANEFETSTTPHWVKPIHVAEFEYATVTKAGKIRKPAIFKGFRTDKKAKDIHLDSDLESVNFSTEEVKEPKAKKVKRAKASKGRDESVPLDSNWPELKDAQRKESKNALEVQGTIIEITGIDKTLWSKEKITKGDLLRYYTEIAPYILPYLKDRPLSLHIKHNGINAKGMYIKGMEGNQPDWAKVFETERKHKKPNKLNYIDYLVCNDTATLIYMINLGCIDVNPWNSRIQSYLNPDYFIIDLDPSDNSFTHVVEVALACKKVLDKMQITAIPKTSGKTGLHLFIPVNNQFTYPEARLITSRLCEEIHNVIPDITTIEDSIAKRGNKIFLDDNQNDEADTVASVYSVRPFHHPSVSTPLEWKEIKKGLNPIEFDIHNTLKRIKKKGDLFSHLFDKKISSANSYNLLSFNS